MAKRLPIGDANWIVKRRRDLATRRRGGWPTNWSNSSRLNRPKRVRTNGFLESPKCSNRRLVDSRLWRKITPKVGSPAWPSRSARCRPQPPPPPSAQRSKQAAHKTSSSGAASVSVRPSSANASWPSAAQQKRHEPAWHRRQQIPRPRVEGGPEWRGLGLGTRGNATLARTASCGVTKFSSRIVTRGQPVETKVVASLDAESRILNPGP